MLLRILLAVFVAALVVNNAFAQTRAAAMNISDRSATISSGGVAALDRIAEREPGLRLMLERAIDAPYQAKDLEVVQSWEVPAGTRFLNSGMDRSRTPIQHYTTAKAAVKVYMLRSRRTGRTVQVKDDCLNPVQIRVTGVPLCAAPNVETTWDWSTVNVQISIQMKQNVNNNQNLSATASTGPISIVFNTINSAPLLVAAAPSPFMMVRDSRGLLSLGYTVGGGMRIFNTNIALGGEGGAGGSASSSSSSSSSASASAAAAAGG